MIDENIKLDLSNTGPKKISRGFLVKEIYPGSLFNILLNFASGIILSVIFIIIFEFFEILIRGPLNVSPSIETTSIKILLLQDLGYIIIFSIIIFSFIYLIKKRKYIAFGLIIGIFLIALGLIGIINDQFYPTHTGIPNSIYPAPFVGP